MMKHILEQCQNTRLFIKSWNGETVAAQNKIPSKIILTRKMLFEKKYYFKFKILKNKIGFKKYANRIRLIVDNKFL